MDKKKVCLVTSEESFCNNYGAALQGYALYKSIENLGFNCFILKYDSLKPTISDNKGSNWNLVRLINAVNRRIYNKKNQDNFQIKKDLFISFCTKMRYLNDRRYNLSSINELENLPDIFVCGSDQIWNPIFKGNKNDPIYFLQFNKNINKRIAYAPSIGISKLPISCKDEMKKYLDTFDFISIREKTGQDIVYDLTKKRVPVLPDPTFLLKKEEWERILVDTEEKNYILLYRFVESDTIDEFVMNFAKRNNLKIITLSMYYQKNDNQYTRKFNVGPAEFLGLIKNAKFVCTESFHATVFSLIFGTPFISFGRKELKNSGDTRISNLLNFFGLGYRLYDAARDYSDEELLDNTEIQNATKYLERYRVIGLEYLQGALND